MAEPSRVDVSWHTIISGLLLIVVSITAGWTILQTEISEVYREMDRAHVVEKQEFDRQEKYVQLQFKLLNDRLTILEARKDR